MARRARPVRANYPDGYHRTGEVEDHSSAVGGRGRGRGARIDIGDLTIGDESFTLVTFGSHREYVENSQLEDDR